MTRIEEPTPVTEATLATHSPDERRRGFAARINLGRNHTPLPHEFWLIMASALILTVLGLVMVLSATSAVAPSEGSPFAVASRQAVAAVVAIPLMLVASRMPERWFSTFAWGFLILGLLLQLLVFMPGIGIEEGGNRAWISLGGQNFQPSEFLKLAYAVWLGSELAKKSDVLGRPKHWLLKVLAVSAFVLGEVVAGRDLGTTMILALILFGALFFAGVKLRLIALMGVFGGLGVVALALTSENRMGRILSFANADKCLEEYESLCWQPLHGLWALAGGGWLGLGLGNSREKYGWLPEAENDYIFAIVGEELGFVGCLVVLALFTVFAVALLQIIQRHPSGFARITTGAIFAWIIGQALTNIAVVLQLLPSLGVPLPFMSQGGTSLIATLLATGVVLSFARQLPPRTRRSAKHTVDTLAA